ncbi:unnamed protein product [Ceratitis capitata]|uniref:(Mediterranean fruit fly) hypothetical protein n=1 Tax=Ceratitis capitata TaxID=7213 RepID=A0A811UWG2_CERCA|nr:unnamed protein product [Ceratitis capitata]
MPRWTKHGRRSVYHYPSHTTLLQTRCKDIDRHCRRATDMARRQMTAIANYQHSVTFTLLYQTLLGFYAAAGVANARRKVSAKVLLHSYKPPAHVAHLCAIITPRRPTVTKIQSRLGMN